MKKLVNIVALLVLAGAILGMAAFNLSLSDKQNADNSPKTSTIQSQTIQNDGSAEAALSFYDSL